MKPIAATGTSLCLAVAMVALTRPGMPLAPAAAERPAPYVLRPEPIATMAPSGAQQFAAAVPTLLADINGAGRGEILADGRVEGGQCMFRLADAGRWREISYYDQERMVAHLGALCQAALAPDALLDGGIRTVIADDLGIEFASWSEAQGPLVIPH